MSRVLFQFVDVSSSISIKLTSKHFRFCRVYFDGVSFNIFDFGLNLIQYQRYQIKIPYLHRNANLLSVNFAKMVLKNRRMTNAIHPINSRAML